MGSLSGAGRLFHNRVGVALDLGQVGGWHPRSGVRISDFVVFEYTGTRLAQ